MILQLTADHGPAVSGAHNCIITARAGKDLVSSLVRRAPLLLHTYSVLTYRLA